MDFEEGKWKQSWQQNRRKIDANIEKPFFEKNLFFLRKNSDFESSKGCKIEENSIKNRLKSEGQDGMPLGIDFLKDFDRFWKQVGKENRAKSEQKPIPKCIKKMMTKKCFLEAHGGPENRSTGGRRGVGGWLAGTLFFGFARGGGGGAQGPSGPKERSKIYGISARPRPEAWRIFLSFPHKKQSKTIKHNPTNAINML